MNDLRNTLDIHCQILFKANFRFDATFYIPKVGQVCCTFKEMLLQSLANVKSPLDHITERQNAENKYITDLKT